MKMVRTTSALGLLMALGLVAPASAEGEAAPAEAPAWMASVTSLANDGGLSLVQDEEDCDDEDEDESEDDSNDEDEDEDNSDDEDEDEEGDEDEEEDECDADEDELA